MNRDGLIEAARAAIRAGRAQDAVAGAERILAADPADIDALEVTALAAAARGDVGAAERALRRIITLDPAAAWARDDLTRLLAGVGRVSDAEQVARDALVADTRDPASHAWLGQFLSGREALPEGAWHLQQALAIAGPDAQLHANLARNLLRQGKLDAAREHGEAAARLAPDALAPAVLRAEIAEQAGDLDAAMRALARAEPLARAAGRDVLLLRAVILSRGDGWREALAMLDALPALSGGAQLLRGRLRDRAGRFGEAWVDVTGAKAALARSAGRRYRREAVEAHFAALAAFPADLPSAAVRTDVPQPVFVLGFPRSGTTLVEQMLAAHPEIRAGGELPFVAEMRDLAATLSAPFPSGLAHARAADRHHLPGLLRDLYLGRVGVHGLGAPGARLFTDKMPLSEAYLPLIRLAFPEAPLVLVRRHPLDVLVSVMMHDMTHGSQCGDRLEDAAHHLAAIDRLVRRHHERLGIAPHLLAYERLVADSDRELALLMAAVGIAPDPAQARFHLSGRHAPTPSYAQVREPLHARAVGRWRNYREALAPVIPIVAEALAAGGYTV